MPANLEARAGDFEPAIAAREAIGFAFRFFLGRLPQILKAVWLPLIVSWIILYFAFDAYLAQLSIFIENPNTRTASLALGLIFAGGFFALFCHAVVTVGVFDLVSRGPACMWAWGHFRAVRREWRLYAAILRLFLVMAVIGGLVGFAVYDLAMAAGLTTYHLILISGVSTLIVALALAAVPGLLIPAIAMQERGAILRRSLRQSSGHFFAFAIIVIVLVAPGIALQTIGEYVMPLLLPVKHFAFTNVLAASAVEFRAVLPWYLALTTVSFEISMTLLTLASYFVHGEIAAARRRQ